MSWKRVDVSRNFCGGGEKIIGKWQERSSSCSVTPTTVSATSGGSVRRAFRFVEWFGAVSQIVNKQGRFHMTHNYES